MARITGVETLSSINLLNLKNMIGDVTIVPGPDGKFEVEIEAQDNLIDLFKFGSYQNTRVYLHGPETQNIQLKSGTMTLTLASGRVLTLKSLPTIKISIPKAILVSFEGSGTGSLNANGLGASCKIETNGSYEINLSETDDLDIEGNGTTIINLTRVDGDLEIEGIGATQINATGNFGDIDVELSGSGNGTITGNCDDCALEINGVGTIHYKGEVRGSLSRSANPGITCKILVN